MISARSIEPTVWRVTLLIGFIALAWAIWWSFTTTSGVTLAPRIALPGFAALAVFGSLALRSFSPVVAFLLSLFGTLVAWRLVGTVTGDFAEAPGFWLLAVAFLFHLGQLTVIIYDNIRNPEGNSTFDLPKLSAAQWHLTLIRMYFAFHFIPHFSEKLFEGPTVRGGDVAAFTQPPINIDPGQALYFVLLAGLCELASAIGLGLGILTRAAACGAALFLGFTIVMGHHFDNGYIWMEPGGGWGYPLLWALMVLSFAVPGGGAFSVDGVVARKWELPRILRRIMGA
ncbi:MAG: DoxX family protein [Rhodobacteraceae bacterium]|nr:DoxX family protein [Paracoccaceae bacterium]